MGFYMGDLDDAAEPTELAGAAEAETQSAYAWSLDDPVEDYPTQRLTPRRITVAATVVSLAVITGAAAVAVMHLRKNDPAPAPAAAPATSTAVTVTTVVAVPAPAALPAPPAPQHSEPAGLVSLPARAGSTWVRTKSGKTFCQITAGQVACNVQSTKSMPYVGGLPASGVKVAAGGGWEWLVGDPGDPDYSTLDYGTVYHTLGWTITPTSEGTTFLNDATGHGMTVSSESFTPF